jgi:hypothetical protein
LGTPLETDQRHVWVIPCPPYAILYYAILENRFLDAFPDNLRFYKRFIDDVFGIWIIADPATDSATWQSFQTA